MNDAGRQVRLGVQPPAFLAGRHLAALAVGKRLVLSQRLVFAKLHECVKILKNVGSCLDGSVLWEAHW